MKSSSDSIRRARPLLCTFVDIAAADAPRSDLDIAVGAAFRTVSEVHRLMSFHEPDSDVSRLNRQAATHAVSVHPWTYEVLEMALELHRASAGVFDVAIAPMMQELGLLPRGMKDFPNVPAPIAGSFTIELLPESRVRFYDPSVRIDLGGIAKGFAVDRAIDILQDLGIPRGLVNAGGDLAAFGTSTHRVHIRDPRDPRAAIGWVEIGNEALASSGGCFDPFHMSRLEGSAIVDPRVRAPTEAISGATVRAPSCVVADALTKVVMIAGEAAVTLLERHGASAIFVTASGGFHVTGDWQKAVHLGA